jgi:outer membrane lipoprotein SlyB
MKNLMLVPVFAVVLGCANTGAGYRPIIDSRNVDFNKYEADLQQCQQFATQTAGAATAGAVGVAAGALFGVALAALGGGNRGASAGVGALGGGVGGAASGETDQRNIIRRCLTGRGYTVLQ